MNLLRKLFDAVLSWFSPVEPTVAELWKALIPPPPPKKVELTADERRALMAIVDTPPPAPTEYHAPLIGKPNPREPWVFLATARDKDGREVKN